MTKAEILKQIEELKKQIEALPDETEEKIRTLPKAGDRGILLLTKIYHAVC